jgi:hypothetical protein
MRKISSLRFVLEPEEMKQDFLLMNLPKPTRTLLAQSDTLLRSSLSHGTMHEDTKKGFLRLTGFEPTHVSNMSQEYIEYSVSQRLRKMVEFILRLSRLR